MAWNKTSVQQNMVASIDKKECNAKLKKTKTKTKTKNVECWLSIKRPALT